MKKVFFIAILTLLATRGMAQSDSLRLRADSLYAAFDFSAAAGLYRQVQMQSDSAGRASLEDRITACVNGESLSEFCFKPIVVARERFAVKDFFLFYPLADSSWHFPADSSLAAADSLDILPWKAFFAADEAKSYAWCEADSAGLRHIMYREKKDSAMGPAIALALPQGADAIFPIINGNKLIFSAKGLYGVGGFDLYSCERLQDGGWSEPSNMGFPFSSQADDFLFTDSPDGKYSLFASSRGCSADSVHVYVIEYDAMPVRKAVTKAEDLAGICALTPSYGLKKVDTGLALDSRSDKDGKSRRYTGKIAEVRQIRDSISIHNRQLDAMRSRYSFAPASEKEFLSSEISRMEKDLPALQARLSAANAELRAIEMEFLKNGVLPGAGAMAAETDKEIVGAGSAFTFTKKNPGRPFNP